MALASWIRLAVIAGAVLLLELLARVGAIDRFTMPPPSEIVWHLVAILVNGTFASAIAKTLTNVILAFCASVITGVTLGFGLHRLKTARPVLEPLFAAYYAIPVY